MLSQRTHHTFHTPMYPLNHHCQVGSLTFRAIKFPCQKWQKNIEHTSLFLLLIFPSCVMDSLGQYFIELKEFIGSLLCVRCCNDLWWYKEGTSLRNSQSELGGYTEKLTVTNALIQLSPGYSGDTRAGWLIQHRVCSENFVGELSLQERMGISQIETRKFF